MKVKVILKDGRAFEFGETAILDDKEAGRAVLSLGAVFGGSTMNPSYIYDERSHVVYAWRDVERLEVTE